MTKSVQVFTDELKLQNPTFFEIVLALRNLVFDHYPNATETIKYGGIMFSQEKEFTGIFVYKNHISQEFSQGFMLADKPSNLEGCGQYRRHLKFHKLADLKTKNIDYYLKQKSALLS